jgi:hypothetical protein
VNLYSWFVSEIVCLEIDVINVQVCLLRQNVINGLLCSSLHNFEINILTVQIAGKYDTRVKNIYDIVY